MPASKKAVVKKKASARKKTAAQVQAEEQAKWERWQKRIVSGALALLGIVVAVNELIFVDKPSETKLVFVATVLGVPLIVGGSKNK